MNVAEKCMQGLAPRQDCLKTCGSCLSVYWSSCLFVLIMRTCFSMLLFTLAAHLFLRYLQGLMLAAVLQFVKSETLARKVRSVRTLTTVYKHWLHDPLNISDIWGHKLCVMNRIFSLLLLQVAFKLRIASNFFISRRWNNCWSHSN